jgi:hypothetical protein
MKVIIRVQFQKSCIFLKSFQQILSSLLNAYFLSRHPHVFVVLIDLFCLLDEL